MGEKEIIFPSWYEYWEGEAHKNGEKEKFDKNIKKALEENKEQIIKFKKKYDELSDFEDSWDDDYQGFFNDTLDFFSIIDGVIDFGADKYKKNDEQWEKIVEEWTEEEAFIELEEYAQSLLSDYWDEI